MKEINVDCRKCNNCDMEKKCCKIFGSNATKAVKKCAKSGFLNYKPKKA